MVKINLGFWAKKTLSSIPGYRAANDVDGPIPELTLEANETLVAALIPTPERDCWLAMTSSSLHLIGPNDRSAMRYDEICRFVFPENKQDWDHLDLEDRSGRRLTIHLPKTGGTGPICGLHSFLRKARTPSKLLKADASNSPAD